MTPRERIFETIKEEMIKNIETAKLKSINEVESLNRELFGYAFYLNEVPNHLEVTEESHIQQDNGVVAVEKPQDEVQIANEDNLSIDEPIDEIDDEPTQEDNNVSVDEDYQLNVGILKRGLANGRIETQDGNSIFIPESIIRRHDYNHGDIIQFEPMIDRGEANHYFYTLVQKSKHVRTDREELSNGIALYDYDSGKYYVKQSIMGVSLKDALSTLDKYNITDQELVDYNIQENSIVDLAWYRDNPSDTIRVIWRH